jgi:hypothetical protein
VKNLTANTKTIAAGAMEATVYEHGEALIQVRLARVALTPNELKVLYTFLKNHYEPQNNTKDEQRKQEVHG